MLLIVGLGNPGYNYAPTRHNVGFWSLDFISSEFKIPLRSIKHQSFIGTGVLEDGRGLVLAKPLTYMNRSGLAVASLARAYKIAPEEILVIHDDMDLPPGKIRLRSKGGSGGHNGLKSIIFHLQSEDFNRLKIGIGRPSDEEAEKADYVLASFSKAEEQIMAESVGRSAEAALYFAREGIEAAMNKYN